MRLFTTVLLLTTCLLVSAQTSETRKWIHTEARYTDSTGNMVLIQNSFPKGGGRYTDASGKTYSYVIFWARVVNESNTPLALKINFPAKPFSIFPSPGSHIRISLPPDTMTFEKVLLFDYGLTHLQSFLDSGLYKPSLLQKNMKPGEEHLFYIMVLFYQAQGSARASLIPKGEDLFFKLSVAPDVDGALIPCGRLVFED